MHTLSIWHVVGFVLTLTAITWVGIHAGRQVKSASDFSTGGGRAGTMAVTGAMVGSLVGGASTIGTAQLAYTNGFSGIWFTLGAGMGCIALMFFAQPLRRNGCVTLQQAIAQEYGQAAGLTSSVLGLVGLFIGLVAQVLSAMALLEALVPLPPFVCALLTVILMALFVLFGGVCGASSIGLCKTVLVYLAAVGGGLLALHLAGGWNAMRVALPAAQYFDPLSRGLGIDLGKGLSMILGILATQTNTQIIFSGRNLPTVRRGLLTAAILIPPIGIGGVLIGIYMRMAAPNVPSAQVFPQFLLCSMPPLVGGVALAALLITIVAASASLVLGIGAIFTENIYRRLRPHALDWQQLKMTRVSIVVTLALSLLFTAESLQAGILRWSFLAIALRAAMILLPLCCALFWPGRVDRRFAMAAIVMGPLCLLVGELAFTLPFDSVFIGMGAAFILMLAGMLTVQFQRR
ncbi:MAG: sodium:solute symporter family protein [Oscillospiraceae bacterium]